VTVTVYFCGGGGELLLPPHAAGRIVARIKRDNAQNFLCFLSKHIVTTRLIKPRGSAVAKSVPVRSNGRSLNAAFNAAAFTVSVALVPGGTDTGEMPHVGMGEGPLTEQASAMLPENPLCTPIVSTSLAWLPRLTVRFCEAGLSVKSGRMLNVAVTAWLEFNVTPHVFGSVPVHAPFQPSKTEFPEGTAVSKTAVPLASRAEQEPPAFVQLIPPELLVTDPLPFPAKVTLSVWL
jgi:hypothetical protein